MGMSKALAADRKKGLQTMAWLGCPTAQYNCDLEIEACEPARGYRQTFVAHIGGWPLHHDRIAKAAGDQSTGKFQAFCHVAYVGRPSGASEESLYVFTARRNVHHDERLALQISQSDCFSAGETVLR